MALGEPGLAAGSLLLFVTNYVSILLTGALVFTVMGFRQAAMSPLETRAQRRALTLAFAALLIIGIPLSVTSYQLIVTNLIAARTYTFSQTWLDGSGYRVLSVDAETAAGTVNLLLLGGGELPPLSKLEDLTRGLLSGRTIRLKVVESQTLYIGT
ncbi:hypothetical protein OOK60_16925 [Trichothermofontia sichuanensis B231]|uniref:hypothetical protein n=1 Tax=Trichothermofontia sichuanensis TaxID=3045816 RepID=UPI002246363B|nr:hypothetical protein [Trichothermofontia sichuanensis]UZQ54145.1 hypothetical protein OOK60_16925 [Trichothermofontia sichuanensis B231]